MRKDQDKKEKYMCDYCSGNASKRIVFGVVGFEQKKKTTVLLSIDGENGVLHTNIFKKGHDFIGSEVPIRYCPKCGSRLSKGETE